MPVPPGGPSQERELLRDRVRQQIRAAILDGTLEAGERLSDDDLLKWLGVSRTPIREALADLAHAGLIEMEPNRYTRVAIPDPDAAVDSLQTLGVLFGGVVRLAVGRMPADAVAQAKASIDDCLRDVKAGDGAALNGHAVELFDVFVVNCGNPPLIRVTRSVEDGLAYQLRLPNIVEILGVEASTREFTKLKEALVAGDAIAAELATEALHHLPARAAS